MEGFKIIEIIKNGKMANCADLHEKQKKSTFNTFPDSRASFFFFPKRR